MEICKICNKEFKQITASHLKTHGISYSEYKQQYTGETTHTGSYEDLHYLRKFSGEADNLSDIYLLSYKKYKYWAGVFYVLCIAITAIMYNYRVLNTLPKLKAIQRQYSMIDSLGGLFNVSDTTTLRNIIRDQILFKPIVTPWEDIKQEKNKYIKERTNLLRTIDNLLEYKHTKTIEESNKRDFLIIENIIANYQQNIEHIQDTVEKGKRRGGLVRLQKTNFLKELEDSLKVTYSKFSQGQLLVDFLNKISMNNLDLNEKYKEHEKFIRQEIVKIDSLKIREISIPSIVVPFKSLDALLVALPVLVLLSIYIQVLYVNFKFYDTVLYEKKAKLKKVPTLKNITKKIGFYIPLEKYLIPILSIVFNLIFPAVLVIFLGVRIANLGSDSYFYFLLIVFIASHLYLYIFFGKTWGKWLL